MKKILFLSFLCLPLFTIAQQAKVKKPVTKKSSQKRAAKKIVKPTTAVIPANTFLITGTLVGIADSTNISLLNGGTGAPEQTVRLKNKSFSFKGSMANPDFKVITVEGQNDYITMFIENSRVKVVAQKDKLATAKITGSAANNDFVTFSNIIAPFAQVFTVNQSFPDSVIQKGIASLNEFINAKPKSFVTPLAILRSFQLSSNEPLMDAQFRTLFAAVKNTNLGQYVGNLVAENAKYPIGKPVANFSQLDTAGNNFNLESLKGKFVLLDFWASWCRPCRQENPNVVMAYNTFKDKNFTVLGISLDQAKPAWLEAIKMDNLTWPHVSDLKGWGNEVAAMYSVQSIPQNFLIDPNGILIGKNLRGEALQKRLAQLIK